MEIWLPRRSRISAGLSLRRSTPSNRISPPAIRPGGRGIRPMIESAVTLLPQPDSPTMPRVRPVSSEKLTPSTAWNSPPSASKYVARFLTSRRHRAVSARPLGSGAGVRACRLKDAASARSRLQRLLHALDLRVDDVAVEHAGGVVARRQKAVEHQIFPARFLEEPAQLHERLRMVVDADVQPGIFLCGVDFERRRLLAALVAAGSLARVERADQALGEGQMSARFESGGSPLDHRRARQHVASDRETRLDQVTAPLDAAAAGVRGSEAGTVKHVQLPHLAALVAREQGL